MGGGVWCPTTSKSVTPVAWALASEGPFDLLIVQKQMAGSIAGSRRKVSNEFMKGSVTWMLRINVIS